MRTDSTEGSAVKSLRPRVLVVDDDPEMRALIGEVLSDKGYEAVEAPNGAQALIRLRSESFAAIVLDKNMPGLSGLDLLPGLRTICPDTPVIFITAFGDVPTYMDAIEKGAFAYIFKPFRMDELLQTLHQALSPAGLARPFPSAAGATP